MIVVGGGSKGLMLVGTMKLKPGCGHSRFTFNRRQYCRVDTTGAIEMLKSFVPTSGM